MRKNNIGVQLHYFPALLQPYYKNLGFGEGDFVEAEKYAKRSFSLPVYPELKDKDIEITSKLLKNLLN